MELDSFTYGLIKDLLPNSSPIHEAYKGKRTNDGAPGTFKAKITKAYGGPVTIEKAKKFKERENATPHDKRQANWFINFHSKNEGLNEVGEANLQPYKWKEDYRNDEDSAYSVKFETESETEYEVIITLATYGNYELEGRYPFALLIEFSAKTKDRDLHSSNIVVNKGELFKVMATITAIVKHYAEQARRRVDILVYTPSKRSQEQALGSQRDKLYKAFISKAIPGVEFKQQADTVIAILPTNSVQERKGEAAPYGSGYSPVEETIMPYIQELTQFMGESGLNIEPLPSVEFKYDPENAIQPLGNTAYYNPNDKIIVLYTADRHPKDILRSFAHEMIHHNQNLEGRLGNITTTNVNEDEALQEIEREAYTEGNMYFRSWENSKKN